MARVIGYVKSLEQGTFFVKDAKGHVHQLKVGEAIHQGETVYGAPNNPQNAKIVVDVTLDGMGDIQLAGNAALHFDTSLLQGMFSHDDAVVSVESVKKALAINSTDGIDTKNTTEAGDETAAGNAITDQERPGSDIFSDRTAAVQDVTTVLNTVGTNLVDTTTPDSGGIVRPVILGDVVNLDEVAPAITSGANASVNENQNVLYTASATDNVDFTNKVVTYSLSGTDAALLNIDSATGVVTLKSGNLDYESKSSYSFTVTASDETGNTSDQPVSVTVNNLDEVAPVMSNQTFTYAENTAAGVTIATVSANDNVGVTGYTFKATGTNLSADGFYQIDNSGVITLTTAGAASAVNDFEQGTNTGSYVITAKDAAGNATDATITLNEKNVNEAPVAVDDYQISGLRAEYYGYEEGLDGANLTNIAQIRDFMASNTPDAIFTPTSLNYALGSGNLGNGTNLQTFLGADAPSLSADPANTSDAIIHMYGVINLSAGTYNFKVTADDGYTIIIDGNPVATVNNIQSPTGTVHAPFTVTDGEHTIEIIYWDQGGDYQFKAEISNNGGTSYQVLSLGNSTHSFVTPEDTPLTIASSTLLSNDTDPDGDTLTITSVASGLGGTVTLVAGNVIFTPTSNYHGDAYFDYTISDGHGGSDTARVYLTVAPINDTPTLTVDTGNANSTNDSVYESGLATGSNPASDGEFAYGKITVGDADGLSDIKSITIGSSVFTVGTSGLAGLVNSTALTTDGKVTLTGYNNGVFDYKYELTKATTDVANQNETDSFVVKVTDNFNMSVQSNVVIDIVDDAPIANRLSTTVVEGTAYSTTSKDDIVLILDRSASMTATAKQSIKDGIANLFDGGTVHAVFIVSFAKDATVENNGQWYTDKTSAMSAINRVYDGITYQNSGGTDYDAAIAKVTSSFIAPPSGGDRLISIFMSDGQPNRDNGTGSNGIVESDKDVGGIGEESAWINFLTSKNFSESYAIGFDGVTDKTQLEPIAWTKGEVASTYSRSTLGNDTNVMLLKSSTEIVDALKDTQPKAQIVTGTLLNDDSGSIVAISGADGWAVDGMPISSATFGAQSHTFTSATDSYTFDLGNVGSVIVYGNGDYTFTGSTIDTANDLSAVVSFVVKDKDGDSATGSLTLTLKDSSDVVAYDNENGAVFTSNKSFINITNVHLDDTDTGSAISTGGKYTSSTFTMVAGSHISFDVALAGKSSTWFTSDSDFVWQLQKQNANGSWSVVYNGTLATSGSVMTSDVVTDGTYRLYFEANDQTSSSNYTADITNITLEHMVQAAGNVLTDSMNLASSTDAWGAVDSKGSEGATLSVLTSGTTYTNVTTSAVTVHGMYGDLVLSADGSYTYTPNSSASAGQQDTFTYKLTQPDGDSDTANLVIKISDSTYVAPMPISGTDGADKLTPISGDDVILGGAGDDTLVFDANDAVMNGGSGIDTLILATSTNIDFTTLANDKIQNVEVIDLGHGGTSDKHSLTNLTLQDVIDMTDGNHTLTIKGDSGDSVNIPTVSGTNYQAAVHTTESGLDVYTYTSTTTDPTVVLKIEQDVQHS